MADREPIAYLAAPLSAETCVLVEHNRARAARWTAWAARNGVSPVCTWITLTGCWDESPHNRRRGLEIDCRLIEVCDVVLWVGGRVSDGMRVEGHHADVHRVPVLDLTALGLEPPQFEFPLREKIAELLEQRSCPVCLADALRRPIDGCPGCGLPSAVDGLSSPGVPR